MAELEPKLHCKCWSFTLSSSHLKIPFRPHRIEWSRQTLEGLNTNGPGTRPVSNEFLGRRWWWNSSSNSAAEVFMSLQAKYVELLFPLISIRLCVSQSQTKAMGNARQNTTLTPERSAWLWKGWWCWCREMTRQQLLDNQTSRRPRVSCTSPQPCLVLKVHDSENLRWNFFL